MSDDELFEFAPAVRENVNLLIALAGASGSGKTKTALELAYGLAGGDESKIGMVDTEAKRALHYARTPGATAEQEPDKYGFLHVDMLPPFRPSRFETVIDAANAKGLKVLIIDSFSHEYDGDGGIMDWATELEEGILKPGKTLDDTNGPDGWKAWASKPVKSPGNWKEPKAAHKHLVQVKMLQARCHLILCLRAEEKIKIGKDDRGKATVEPMGWMPICEKRFMFEMTLSLTLRPDRPGIPQFDLPHKMQDQHRPFFPEGQYITRETGARLAEWAAGGRKAGPLVTPEGYVARVTKALARGENAAEITTWWNSDKEKSLRDQAGLSAAQAKELMQAVTARTNELNQSADGGN